VLFRNSLLTELAMKERDVGDESTTGCQTILWSSNPQRVKQYHLKLI
jgi:hypothetical protein